MALPPPLRDASYPGAEKLGRGLDYDYPHDHPEGVSGQELMPADAQGEQFLEEIERTWGGPVGLEARAPSVANDPAFREWWSTYLRMGASPGAALALTRMNADIDIRQLLPAIRVPTLIIHRAEDRCLTVDDGRSMVLGKEPVFAGGQSVGERAHPTESRRSGDPL